VLVVQGDPFNRSRTAMVACVAITGNLLLAEAPGNVRLSRRSTGLPRDSVVNV
jgi:mRNA interferase MazF